MTWAMVNKLFKGLRPLPPRAPHGELVCPSCAVRLIPTFMIPCHDQEHDACPRTAPSLTVAGRSYLCTCACHR